MPLACVKTILVGEFFEGSAAANFVCKFCQKKISLPKRKSGISYTNLAAHLERKDHSTASSRYEEAVNKYKQLTESASEASAGPTAASSSGRQLDLPAAFAKSQAFRRGAPGDQRLQELVMEWLVGDGLPWTTAESPRLARVLAHTSGGRASLRIKEIIAI